MRIVLDTNVFLVSVLPHHKYWWVFQALLDREYDLLVSTEILIEYLEKCVDKYGLSASEEKLDFLVDLPNVHLVTPSYHWQLIYPARTTIKSWIAPWREMPILSCRTTGTSMS